MINLHEYVVVYFKMKNEEQDPMHSFQRRKDLVSTAIKTHSDISFTSFFHIPSFHGWPIIGRKTISKQPLYDFHCVPFTITFLTLINNFVVFQCSLFCSTRTHASFDQRKEFRNKKSQSAPQIQLKTIARCVWNKHTNEDHMCQNQCQCQCHRLGRRTLYGWSDDYLILCETQKSMLHLLCSSF